MSEDVIEPAEPAGAPYIVGKRGPELFNPEANGTILPNESDPPADRDIRTGDSAQGADE